MPVFIAFLRGINVGGNKMIPMAALKELFDDLGFKNVRTLLQSGNVVFSAKAATNAALAAKIAAAIRKRFGSDVEVVIRTSEELRKAVARNPFPAAAQDDPSHLLIVFLAQAPSSAAGKAIAAAKFKDERFRLEGTELFAHYGAGIGHSKVPSNFIEKTLGVSGTARNWNTVTKLIALATALKES